MLKKLNLKKQIGISLTFLVFTLVLFSIAVFGLLGRPYSGHVLLNYFFVGLGLGLYVFILLRFNLNYAFLLFILGYFFSYGTLFYVFSYSSDGFGDLAGFLGWMIIMGLVIALGITLELLLYIRRKQRQERKEHRDVIDVEAVEVIEHDDETAS